MKKEVMKAIQNLKTEFSEEVKILKRTEAEIKVELNISITQLGNTEESVECFNVEWIKLKIEHRT